MDNWKNFFCCWSELDSDYLSFSDFIFWNSFLLIKVFTISLIHYMEVPFQMTPMRPAFSVRVKCRGGGRPPVALWTLLLFRIVCTDLFFTYRLQDERRWYYSFSQPISLFAQAQSYSSKLLLFLIFTLKVFELQQFSVGDGWFLQAMQKLKMWHEKLMRPATLQILRSWKLWQKFMNFTPITKG